MRVTNDSDSNGPSCTIMNAKILYTHFFGSCRRENFLRNTFSQHFKHIR